MRPITVALVNDYEVVVQGLAAILRNYREALELVPLPAGGDGREVDIALYDTFAGAPGDGVNVRSLVADPHVRRVVVYSWHVDERLVAAAFDNGADAYLPKALSASQLVRDLRAVAAGEQLGPSFPPRRFATPVAGDWPGREEGLTPRESEVLAMITQGLSNDEITRLTHLSINSVKSYIRSCYRRIGVHDRTHAVLWGIDHGFRPDRARLQEPPHITAPPTD